MRMRKAKTVPGIALAIALMGAGTRLPAAALDPVLLGPGLWELDRDAFAAQVPSMGFQWVSQSRDSARSAAPGLTFAGQPVVEAVVRFASNRVSDVALSFYNRGDAGDLPMQEFERRVAETCARFDELAGGKGREVVTRQAVRADRKSKRMRWETQPSVYIVEWAYSRRQNAMLPEFLNAFLSPAGGARAGTLAGSQRVADVGRFSLQRRVVRTPEGDAYLGNVPMVDQGQKGYCAVAATERVMRYYGVAVNQHELAQRASTASGGGTDPASLIKALKSMTNVLGVRIKTLEDFQPEDLQERVHDYNRAAERQNQPEVLLPNAGVVNITDIYAQMNPDTFVKMRGRNRAQVERFSKMVKEKINAGYPVLWGVMLGLVEEQPALPQASGGHLRLLIGYNTRTQELLYTDSWGAGHELKRMPESEAYAITMTLHTIEPR